MNDSQKALQDLLQAAAGGDSRFPPGSRYHGVGVTTRENVDGRLVAHLKRRLVPPPEEFETLEEHEVRQGDRLDNLAARHLGDPERFWQLCDANGVLNPAELEEVGRRLRVTPPRGVPGHGGLDG